MKLDEEQAQNMKNMFAGKDQLPVTMRLRVRPLTADFEEPLQITDTDFWIMTGDIAFLSFETETEQNKDQEIYSYTASWYLSDTEEELLDLLR